MSPKLTARDRFERMLSIVPWVAANDGPGLDEIAARFDYPRERLLSDLNDVVFMVGVYPFTPDQLIEVAVVDDRVWIEYADYFARPLRLAPEQALALVTAGSSLLTVPGAERDGPLARGLEKLARVLGVAPGDTVAVDLGSAPAEAMETLRAAIDDCRAVELDYYSYGRDERRSRVVEPHRLFAEGGQWYLAAHCRTASGERVFRLDRMRSVERLDSTFEPPAVAPSTAIFSPRPGDPRVTLRLGPSSSWVLEHYPYEARVDHDDGTTEVTIAVSAVPWLERLLLRLGAEVTVVSVSGDISPDLGRSAASQVLERYRVE